MREAPLFGAVAVLKLEKRKSDQVSFVSPNLNCYVERFTRRSSKRGPGPHRCAWRAPLGPPRDRSSWSSITPRGRIRESGVCHRFASRRGRRQVQLSARRGSGDCSGITSGGRRSVLTLRTAAESCARRRDTANSIPGSEEPSTSPPSTELRGRPSPLDRGKTRSQPILS